MEDRVPGLEPFEEPQAFLGHRQGWGGHRRSHLLAQQLGPFLAQVLDLVDQALAENRRARIRTWDDATRPSSPTAPFVPIRLSSTLPSSKVKFTFWNTVERGAWCPGRGLERLFITGVTPVVLSDLTSGLNIAKNVSLEPELNALAGFTEIEIEALLEQCVAARRESGKSFAPLSTAIPSVLRSTHDLERHIKLKSRTSWRASP
ncbi:MAG: AAA family ATPase [bacterium]|nr:AAA family ATPase [bacterium]